MSKMIGMTLGKRELGEWWRMPVKILCSTSGVILIVVCILSKRLGMVEGGIM